jgi:hypothetical protein
MRLRSIPLVVFLAFTLTPVQSQPGTLKSVEGPISLSKEIIYDSLLSAAGDLSPDLMQKIVHPNYDVNAYKIIYSTTDLQGAETEASGALFIPDNPEAAKPLVAYLHGTLTRDQDAPSGLTGTETIIGWMFAMNGYLTILPDYLGMGEGPGLHPYLHKQSEASATVDMIKASLAFLQQEGIPFINDLYLCGYSQGGHAAVATQQYIESLATPVVNLKINIAGSGPYYLSHIQKKFTFANDTYESPCFMPYLLMSYQAAYGNLYSSSSQVFVYPYDEFISSWFDGSLTLGEIDALLPVTWKTMFQPAYLNGIANNYFHPANRAFRANDLVRWKPKTKLRLYYTTADELVDKDNSIAAWLMYVLQGATDVVALPVGNYKHAEAAAYVFFLAKSVFDCLSGVNPCPIDVNPSGTRKSAATDDQTEKFLRLLQETDKPDPWEYLAKPQYAGLLSEAGSMASESLLNIFPQPASDKAWIDLLSMQGESITLRCFDFTGRLLIHEERIPANGLYSIDCHKLNSGIYTVVVSGSTFHVTKMVVLR